MTDQFALGLYGLFSDQLVNGVEYTFLAVGMGDVCIRLDNTFQSDLELVDGQ